jgi:glycolate oxidase subunit GlcD
MKKTHAWLPHVKKVLGHDEIFFDSAILAEYAADKWFASHQPDAVALPKSTEAVSRLLSFANRHRIPLTPRGAGYGYVGGCVPVRGGIVLSLERLNRIREISRADFVAVVQAGVTTGRIHREVEKKGLFYPPDPASQAHSSIGGNIATNAGGPRCLKYGVTRDYVLGLQVVSADGTILQLGGRTHKNKTGFDLHRLFVGSEGMLGVVTEATLKLLPLPASRACLAVGYRTMQQGLATVQSIFRAGFLPAALEIADEFTVAAAYKRTRNERLRNSRAHIIIELDGQKRSVKSELSDMKRLLSLQTPLFIQTGFGRRECEAIWGVRREFSYALRDTGLTKLNEDVVVPRGRIADLFAFAARLQKKHGMPVACFGHAGDGNIHTNIMIDLQQPGSQQRSNKALDELFSQVIKWGGAITGENGIGLAKQRWWPLAVDEDVRRLHRQVKRALDPRGILNPGKFI